MKTCAIISSILGLSYCLPAASLPDIVWQTDPQPNGVLDVIFSADGQRLVSANGLAKIWDITGNLVRTFSIPNDDVAAVAVSPDGLRLAGGGGSGGFRIWNVSDGSVLWVAPTGGSGQGVQDLAFSPDGTRLAWCGRSIGISNSTNLYEGLLLDEVHSQGVQGLAFSPDGSLLGFYGTDGRAASASSPMARYCGDL